MHSPEQHIPEPSTPQERKTSVDYGNVTSRLKNIREMEVEESIDSTMQEQYMQDLEKLGLNADDLTDSDIQSIKIEGDRERDQNERVFLKSRLTELQQTDKPLVLILELLEQEFGDSMDKETRAVIDNFKSLVSPEIIPDEEEREAVEVLFATQSLAAFNLASFTGFVETIYKEEAISEETKQRIEKKFGIPRNPIKSGKELVEWTLKTDDEGNYLHHSPETALEFRKGVKTHVDKQGNTLLTIASNARTEPLAISPERLRNGESLASLANYSLIRNAVYDEFDGMTNLFGGGDEDDLPNPSDSAIHDANLFARILIGKRSPDSILTKEDMTELKHALTAMHNPANTGEEAAEEELQELGVLSNGNIQWNRVEKIGRILREKRNYRAFELAHMSDANRLLKEELKARSEHERQPIEEAMHGTGTSVHEFGLRREAEIQELVDNFLFCLGNQLPALA